jgi:hypothetical protein
VLASDGLKERCILGVQGEDKHFVPMCSDPCRSSYADHLYKHTFDGLIDIDIAKTTTLAQPCPQLTGGWGFLDAPM